MKSEIETLPDRIRECAKIVGSAAQLARMTGINRRTLEYYLVGTSEPKASAISQIVKVAGVDAMWLLTGEGEMYGPTRGRDDNVATPLDLSRMQNVIEQTEKFLLNNELVLEPEDKARLFIAVYNVLTEKYKDEAFDQDFLDAHPNVIVMAALGK